MGVLSSHQDPYTTSNKPTSSCSLFYWFVSVVDSFKGILVQSVPMQGLLLGLQFRPSVMLLVGLMSWAKRNKLELLDLDDDNADHLV